MGFSAVAAIVAEGATDAMVVGAVTAEVGAAAMTVGSIAADGALVAAGTSVAGAAAADVGGLAALDSAAVIGEGAAAGLSGASAAAAAGTDLADVGGLASLDSASVASQGAAPNVLDSGLSGTTLADESAGNAASNGVIDNAMSQGADVGAQVPDAAPSASADPMATNVPPGTDPMMTSAPSGTGSPPDTPVNTSTVANTSMPDLAQLPSAQPQTIGDKFGQYFDKFQAFAKTPAGAQVVGGALKGIGSTSQAAMNRKANESNAASNAAKVQQSAYGSAVASYNPIIATARKA